MQDTSTYQNLLPSLNCAISATGIANEEKILTNDQGTDDIDSTVVLRAYWQRDLPDEHNLDDEFVRRDAKGGSTEDKKAPVVHHHHHHRHHHRHYHRKASNMRCSSGGNLLPSRNVSPKPSRGSSASARSNANENGPSTSIGSPGSGKHTRQKSKHQHQRKTHKSPSRPCSESRRSTNEKAGAPGECSFPNQGPKLRRLKTTSEIEARRRLRHHNHHHRPQSHAVMKTHGDEHRPVQGTRYHHRLSDPTPMARGCQKHQEQLHKCRSRRHQNHHGSDVLHCQLQHGVLLCRDEEALEAEEEENHGAQDCSLESLPELQKEEEGEEELDSSSRRMSNLLFHMPLAAVASKAPKMVTGTALVAAKTTMTATSMVASGAQATATSAAKTTMAATAVVASGAQATATSAAKTTMAATAVVASGAQATATSATKTTMAATSVVAHGAQATASSAASAIMGVASVALTKLVPKASGLSQNSHSYLSLKGSSTKYLPEESALD